MSILKSIAVVIGISGRGGVNLRVATVRLCKTISAKLEIFAFEDNEVI